MEAGSTLGGSLGRRTFLGRMAEGLGFFTEFAAGIVVYPCLQAQC